MHFCTDKPGKVNTFLVYKVDRFARNQHDHAVMSAVLKRAGTRLDSVSEPIDETSMGKCMEGVLSVFAEFDNNVRTERSTQGMKSRVREGKWQWAAPYGYTRITKGANISPEPNTAPFVKEVFQEFAKGTYTFGSLAEHMAKRGMLSKTGKTPSMQMLSKMLRNPVYAGIIVGMSEVNQGSFEPLVSEELFKKCQEIIDDKKRGKKTRTKHSEDFPLRNQVKCSHCGQKLTGSWSRGKNKRYPYYHHGSRKCPVDSRSLPKEEVEEHFVELLKDLQPTMKYQNAFKMVVLQTWKQKHAKVDKRNRGIRKMVEKLEQERQKVFESQRKGLYTDEEFLEQKNQIDDEIKRQEGIIQEYRKFEYDMSEVMEHTFRYLADLPTNWLEHSLPQKLQLQNILFAEIPKYVNGKFGTPKVSPILQSKNLHCENGDSLVTPRGIEPRFPG